MTGKAKKTITAAQYHQLLGLRLLADGHYAALAEIEKAALQITDERNSKGELDANHTQDWLGASRDTDEMLRLLDIEVEP